MNNFSLILYTYCLKLFLLEDQKDFLSTWKKTISNLKATSKMFNEELTDEEIIKFSSTPLLHQENVIIVHQIQIYEYMSNRETILQDSKLLADLDAIVIEFRQLFYDNVFKNYACKDNLLFNTMLENSKRFKNDLTDYPFTLNSLRYLIDCLKLDIHTLLLELSKNATEQNNTHIFNVILTLEATCMYFYRGLYSLAPSLTAEDFTQIEDLIFKCQYCLINIQLNFITNGYYDNQWIHNYTHPI